MVNLYKYVKNDIPFGLQGNTIDYIKYEASSSRYLRHLIKTGKNIINLHRGLLLDVDYDGIQNKAFCKFYDFDSGEIKIWIDSTEHYSYCLTKILPDKLLDYEKLMEFNGLKRFETIKKYDLLNDEEINMTKIYVNTPSNIAGGKENVKSILEENVWEANIKYHHNYIYDLGLIPGMIYEINNDRIKQIDYMERDGINNIFKELENLFTSERPELREYAIRNIEVFLTPIPETRRLALDIETTYNRNIPDPKVAKETIISISFVDNQTMNVVYILNREGFEWKERDEFPENTEIIFFDNERDLLIESFRLMWMYPIILTFNGDNFDLAYMYHRALKLKIPLDMNPIRVKKGYGALSRFDCVLIHGIHIDLYPFFANKSIQGYAFSGAYNRNDLNTISSALLKEEKYQHEEEIDAMDYGTLAWYNLKDSILTLKLTTYNNGLVWNLLILLCRMTKLPIHDMTRRLISAWNKSLFYYEHRQRNCLIPNRKDIEDMKQGGYSQSTTGKDFKGAMVIDTIPGIHFDTVVMDFSSLYPTIIKEHNLSYETIQCPHEECKDNLLPDVPYYTCTKKMGMLSYIVGFVRDVRVNFFKPKSSDKSLSEKQRSYYMTIQQALKVFINSAYGVAGSKKFQFFCLPVAESTTGLGRRSTTKLKNKSEEKGVRVLYGDTDSTFLDNPSEEVKKDLIKFSKEELNLDLEEEKTFQFLALSKRKKNYVGIHKGSKKQELKGVTGKKKNTPPFIKRIFMGLIDVLKNITNTEEFDNAKKNIINIMRKGKKKIGRTSGYPLEDYAVNTVLQKKPDKYGKVIPQHVTAAKLLTAKTGYKFEKGDIVTYIKTRGNYSARPIEFCTIGQIDAKKYEELLKSTLEQLLDALGIPYEESENNMKLDTFF